MKKQLKDLTLLSKFLFEQTMEMPEAHEAVLQIVLENDAIRLLSPAQTESLLKKPAATTLKKSTNVSAGSKPVKRWE